MSGDEEAAPRESAVATRCWVRVERLVRPGRRDLMLRLATVLPADEAERTADFGA
jgi:hypothetical protein